MTAQVAEIEVVARSLVPRARAGDDEALSALLLCCRVPLLLLLSARVRQALPVDVQMEQLRWAILEAVILWQGEPGPLWVEVVEERLRRRIGDYHLRQETITCGRRLSPAAGDYHLRQETFWEAIGMTEGEGC